MEDADLLVIELRAHLVDLLAAHAMFTGDAAAGGHAQFQNPAADLLGQLKLPGLVGIEQDQRVHVAVTGMEDIGHREP